VIFRASHNREILDPDSDVACFLDSGQGSVSEGRDLDCSKLFKRSTAAAGPMARRW